MVILEKLQCNWTTAHTWNVVVYRKFIYFSRSYLFLNDAYTTGSCINNFLVCVIMFLFVMIYHHCLVCADRFFSIFISQDNWHLQFWLILPLGILWSHLGEKLLRFNCEGDVFTGQFSNGVILMKSLEI